MYRAQIGVVDMGNVVQSLLNAFATRHGEALTAVWRWKNALKIAMEMVNARLRRENATATKAGMAYPAIDVEEMAVERKGLIILVFVTLAGRAPTATSRPLFVQQQN